jgi:hypothetical protein
MSSKQSTVILLYFAILGLRLLLNGSFPAIWNAEAPTTISAAKADATDVQTAFKHVVILLLVLVILTAIADTPAYPLAIGIETVALIYILLLNSSSLSGKITSVTGFIGSK